MNDKKMAVKVKKREEDFASSIKTKIWHEQAAEDNPYATEQCFIHGYNLLELSSAVDFLDAIYLNIRGELPGPEDKALFNSIFVAISNLGPRHAATRTVMNVAVSKTRPEHFLPIGLSILGGSYGGAAEVEGAVRFIRKHINKCPEEVAQGLIKTVDPEAHVIAPGFGKHYGSLDIIAGNMSPGASSTCGTHLVGAG